jgi:hypothetical protein
MNFIELFIKTHFVITQSETQNKQFFVISIRCVKGVIQYNNTYLSMKTTLSNGNTLIEFEVLFPQEMLEKSSVRLLASGDGNTKITFFYIIK